MRRTGIFFLSLQGGPERQRLELPNGGAVYVRVVETNLGLSDALSAAGDLMLDGDMVMNTHPVDAESYANAGDDE